MRESGTSPPHDAGSRPYTAPMNRTRAGARAEGQACWRLPEVAAFALACLIGCLSACTADVKPGAEGLLSLSTGPTAVESAVWAIDPYDADKRYRGTLFLASQPFGGDDVYIQLYLANAKDEDAGVRSAALRGLGNHGKPEQAEVVAAGLKDPEPIVRREAARSLQRLHYPKVMPDLLRAVSEKYETDADVRREAATALGQYPDARVLQPLIAALGEDTSLAVQQSARMSMRTLTGQDFGFDRRQWLDWLSSTKEPFAARQAYLYPAFNRERAWYEYLPFVTPPPNEASGAPAGSSPAIGNAE